MNFKENLAIFILVATLVLSVSLSFVAGVTPNGASITEENSTAAPTDTAGQDEAIAGNVSLLTISAYSTTQTWQGYFGNISGAIQLTDASDNVLYNWSLANPSGEVYSSANESISWVNIQCFNFTAAGGYSDESGNGGQTNVDGTNLTTLETQYNLNASAGDGVDETFTLSGAGSHDVFYTANQQFSEGECRSTRVFGDSGAGVSNEFEEVLLYEPTTQSVVFASLIESGSVLGFDNNDYDFEMLVLEDGHGVDTSSTTYYFFVELE